jgi:hypothetical protein
MAFSHGWCGEDHGELRQAEPVPAEHAAACLNNTACELVGSIKACPNDQQLFRWIAETEPSAATCDAAMAHRGDASGCAHTHTLRSAERDGKSSISPVIDALRRRADECRARRGSATPCIWIRQIRCLGRAVQRDSIDRILERIHPRLRTKTRWYWLLRSKRRKVRSGL